MEHNAKIVILKKKNILFVIFFSRNINLNGTTKIVIEGQT